MPAITARALSTSELVPFALSFAIASSAAAAQSAIGFDQLLTGRRLDVSEVALSDEGQIGSDRGPRDRTAVWPTTGVKRFSGLNPA